MEISEGDQVVTPEGEVDQVVRVTEIPDPCGPQVWLKERKLHLGQDKLIRVDQPIRVRVSRECYAESLVALAEECGFGTGELSPNIRGPHYPFVVVIGDGEDYKAEGKYVKCMDCLGENVGHYDLTYRDDLPQIEAWLECHSESEGECKKCRIIQKKRKEGEPIFCAEHDPALHTDCPDESDNTMSVNDDDERWIQNDTDESEEYDEPKSEDQKWYKDSEARVDFITRLFGGRANGKNSAVELLDYIDEIEQELSDCWKNQKEYKNDVANLHRQNGELRERIEEAREQLQYGNDGRTEEILSPDYDEGDGCEEKHA